mmetsp:Transcript_28196/g.72457  ORF Transcript_28196/g.72457 Transcript_28196/m.72457 type:complete len:214 (+) Transcript_28196:141-782(+)
MGPADRGLRRRHHHHLPTMRLPLGTAITVRFGDITDAAKKRPPRSTGGWVRPPLTWRRCRRPTSSCWMRLRTPMPSPLREQARAYPPRSGHYRRNHSEAAQAGVAWHFWQWFPLSAMSRAVDAMNQRRHTEKGGSSVVPFSLAEFKVFLAVLLAMTLHSTVSLEELWDNPAVPSIKAMPTRYGFAALMTQRRFNEWRAYFRFWGDPGDLPDSH